MAIDRGQAEELLRAGESGIGEWNRRRLAGEAIPPLDDADLSKAQLKGVDLQGANLSRANLSGADLSGANLSNSILRDAVLVEATLLGANFSGAVLSGVDLRRTECLLAPGSVQPFEQLKLFFEYTKWHVQLYAGGTLAALVLTDLVKGRSVLVPLFCFLAAAACAGTLLGNVSRFASETTLNGSKMEALGRTWRRLTGARVRFLEKVFFWCGAVSLVAVVYCRPATPPPAPCCVAVATPAVTTPPLPASAGAAPAVALPAAPGAGGSAMDRSGGSAGAGAL